MLFFCLKFCYDNFMDQKPNQNETTDQTAEASKVIPGEGTSQMKSLLEEHPGVKYLVPIGRSGLAIAAGYVALLGTLVIPAPLGIVLGILALRDIKKHPEKLGKTRAWFAIVYCIGVLLTASWIIFQISRNQ